eukprot:1326958-Pleurochrysis_carterae.AAC.2
MAYKGGATMHGLEEGVRSAAKRAVRDARACADSREHPQGRGRRPRLRAMRCLRVRLRRRDETRLSSADEGAPTPFRATPPRPAAPTRGTSPSQRPRLQHASRSRNRQGKRGRRATQGSPWIALRKRVLADSRSKPCPSPVSSLSTLPQI